MMKKPVLLKNLSNKQQGYAYTIITMFIWGSFSLLARMNAYWQIQVWDILALRFIIASLILLPILYYKKELGRLLNRRMAALALTGSIGYCAFVYSGFYYAPVVHGVVFLNGTFPLFTAIMAYFLLKEKINRQNGLGLGIIILTLALMSALMVNSKEGFGIGDLLFIGSAICWGLFSVFLRKWKFSAWQVMSGVAIWSAIIYLPLYALLATPQLDHVKPEHLLIQGIFHGVLVVIVATLTYAKAVEKIGLFKAGSIATLAPFLAALIAVPLLGETLNPIMICGLIGMGAGALQPWRWFLGK